MINGRLFLFKFFTSVHGHFWFQKSSTDGPAGLFCFHQTVTFMLCRHRLQRVKVCVFSLMIVKLVFLFIRMIPGVVWEVFWGEGKQLTVMLVHWHSYVTDPFPELHTAKKRKRQNICEVTSVSLKLVVERHFAAG